MNTHLCVCVRTHNWRCVCDECIVHIYFPSLLLVCKQYVNVHEISHYVFTPVAWARATFFLTHFSRFLFYCCCCCRRHVFFSLSFFNKNRIITIASIVHSIDNTVTLNRWCCNEIGSSCSTSCRPYRTKVEHFRRIQSIRRWKSFDNSTNRPTAKCGASAVPGLQSK